MKTLRFPLYLALGAASLLSACKKDKDKDEAKPKTKTELLTDKSWMMTAQTVNPAMRTNSGRVITDLYAEMDPCDQDDLLQFAKPDSYTLNESNIKCNPNGPQSFPGTWSFGNNESTLTLKLGNQAPNTYNIEEISDNTMRLTETGTSGGASYTITYTFSKR
ncbi:lipocalin family protein [Solirubrum puertoriconensis]|uniref:Lipocalin-like domain-containing protein n=1 Tax=Solirubrum puertoriconensis TaxID=1751427 RepID=A0A9X0HHT9_SOLP1|nr:lipocalin family protein [Solirubrum puertoriconensis]KUG06164.1 hypothetical protein ASU33_02005 [Solirubrum puertoriconensis]